MNRRLWLYLFFVVVGICSQKHVQAGPTQPDVFQEIINVVETLELKLNGNPASTFAHSAQSARQLLKSPLSKTESLETTTFKSSRTTKSPSTIRAAIAATSSC